jgi:predicted nucleotidyltransferase
MSLPKELINKDKGLMEWSIITAYRGSISHGMYVPKNDPDSIDDKDLMCVCIPPIDYYFGFKYYGKNSDNKWSINHETGRGTREIKFNEWDVVIYEFRKFISLLCKGNPNVLSMLWLEDKHYIKLTEFGKRVIENRDLFVSKNVFYNFIGYAKGQLHRMTHTRFQGYMGDKRKQLVERFGYDTKNASHLIRLLRMCIEFLNDGCLHVERKHDATELLDIKKGEWSLEKIKSEAEHLFKLAEQSYIKSDLTNRVDMNKINDFTIKLLKDFFDFKK